MTLLCGIYSITSPNGKCYIGSAGNIHKRWRAHRCALRAGNHHSWPLQRAFLKYGEHGFKFEVLELVQRGELITREQAHIDAHDFKRLYNVLPRAGSTTGRVISPAMRERLSAKLKGRVFSPATRARMRAAQLGVRQKPETIAKRAAVLRGRECSQATRTKISKSQQGKLRRESPNTSGFVGVTAYDGKWRAQIGSVYLGYHTTPEAAATALARYKATGDANPLRTNNTSGFKGVVAKGTRWQASKRIDGKRFYVGSFPTPEAANAAVQAFKGPNNDPSPQRQA
jgi:group I intron endonuclease